MRTEHLAYILEVAHCRSISMAAKKLFIGQTTLSAIIQSIESELGIRIFERSYQGIRVTHQGEIALSMIENMLNQNNALHELANGSGTSRKFLHLVSYPSGCQFLSLPLSKSMQDYDPDMVLVFHEASYSKTISQIISGEARICVGGEADSLLFSRQCEAQEAGLCFETVYEDSFYLAVSAFSPLADRNSIDLSELYKEHLATTESYPLATASPTGRVFRNFSRFTVFSNQELVKRAIALGGMIGLIPRLAFLNDIYVETGKIRLLPLTGFPSKLVNYLVYRPEIDEAEEKLLTELRCFYQSLPSITK